MEYITHSPAETEAVGEALAKTLRPGTVLAFRGDLGAGKTAFTRGLGRGLGCTERVTSPTYTIVNEYTSGRLPLFHFDMYRLRSSEDLFDIGWEDYLEREKEEAEKERQRAERRAANPDGITENTSKKKLAQKQQKEADAAKAAAAKEYAARKGLPTEPETEEKLPLSGMKDRPNCKGRAYEPDRYRNTEE